MDLAHCACKPGKGKALMAFMDKVGSQESVLKGMDRTNRLIWRSTAHTFFLLVLLVLWRKGRKREFAFSLAAFIFVALLSVPLLIAARKYFWNSNYLLVGTYVCLNLFTPVLLIKRFKLDEDFSTYDNVKSLLNRKQCAADFGVALLVLSGVFFGAAEYCTECTARHYSEGRRLYGQGDYVGAAMQFSESLGYASVISKKAAELEALLWLGAAQRKFGQLDAALENLERVRLRSMNDTGKFRREEVLALRQMAQCQSAKGNHGLALALMQRSMWTEYASDSRFRTPAAYALLGKLQLEADAAKASVESFTQAVQLATGEENRPLRAQALVLMGIAHQKMDDAASSRLAYEQALELYSQLGETAKAGRIEEALHGGRPLAVSE